MCSDYVYCTCSRKGFNANTFSNKNAKSNGQVEMREGRKGRKGLSEEGREGQGRKVAIGIRKWR